ncbi:hypothetical protein pb186bvf_009236 [Paramecium bursaria]
MLKILIKQISEIFIYHYIFHLQQSNILLNQSACEDLKSILMHLVQLEQQIILLLDNKEFLFVNQSLITQVQNHLSNNLNHRVHDRQLKSLVQYDRFLLSQYYTR